MSNEHTDKERLDWLENSEAHPHLNATGWTVWIDGMQPFRPEVDYQDSLRDAIDQAMNKDQT